MVQFEALKSTASSKGSSQNGKGYWIPDCESDKKNTDEAKGSVSPL